MSEEAIVQRWLQHYDSLHGPMKTDFEDAAMAVPYRVVPRAHFAVLDGGPVTIALATAVDHPTTPTFPIEPLGNTRAIAA
jgi:hypothetical protein